MTCKLVARALGALALLAGSAGALFGQTPYPQGDASAAAQQPTYPAVSGVQGQANVQAVATSGLLPVYGIELRADRTWVDSQFPSRSTSFPNSGVSSAFQAAWDSLKTGGFNILRLPIDVRDSQSANRLANICAWAKSNNVKVLPVLVGATQADYDSKAAALVKAVVSALKSGQASDAYLQITAYQLDDEMNHVGVHGPLPSSIAQQLVRAAQNIRAAEKQALDGSGTEPTPLMVDASFDYELIQVRAIAGVPFSDAAYQQAYSSLLRFLQPLAQSPDLDVLSVTWFPGTVSAGTVEKPPGLIRSLVADLGGKQIVFTTGFSTAFASADDQKNYYTMIFANVGDLRASAGGESPFMGVVFHEALNGKNPQTPKGVGDQMKTWDWPAKADELSAMWNGKRKSDDMKWWWEKVQSNMGLASLQISAGNPQLTAQPAQAALGQIASAVSETNAATPYPQYPGQNGSSTYPGGATGGYPTVGAAAGATSSPSSGGSPSSPTFKDQLQARLVGLLDAAIQQVGTRGGSPSGRGAGCYPAPGSSCGSTGQYPTSAGQYPGSYPGDSTAYPGQSPQSGQYPNTTQYPGQQQSSQYPNQPYSQGQGDPNQYNQYPPGQDPHSNQYPDPNQQYPNQPGQNSPGDQYPASNNPNVGAGTAYPDSGGSTNSIAPGSIVVSPQDVVVQPGSPQVGQPVTLAAKLRNQGSTDATGLIVVISDQANTVLAQADGVNVARGSVSPVTLQFLPAEPQASLPLVLHASDPFGNEIASAPLLPITIAPLPADSLGGTPPGSASGIPSDSLAPGATGQTKLFSHLGAARLALVSPARYYVVGEPMPVMANLSNPFAIPMTNVRGTLFVDGVSVRRQVSGTLFPHQSRSMVFSGIVVSKPGTHEIRVVVESQRGNAKPQVSYIVSKLTFYPRSASPLPRGIGTSTSLHPGAGSGTASAVGAAPKVRSIYSPPLVASARPMASAGMQAGSPSDPRLQPAAPNSSSGPPTLNSRNISQGGSHNLSQSPSLYARSGASPSGLSNGTRSIGSPGTTQTSRGNPGPGGPPSTSSGSLPNVPMPFVTLNPNDISYGPPTAKPGQPITFNVIVRNSADAPAQRVSLVLKLFADGKLVALTQQPIQFSVRPRGASRVSWQAGMPAGKQVELMAVVTADGDTNPNGKQISISVRNGVGSSPLRLGTGVRVQR